MTREELTALVHELLTQDNLATAHPLYRVEEQVRICGLDSAHGEQFEWINEDGDWCGGTYYLRHVIKEEEDLDVPLTTIDPADYGYQRVYYSIVWKVVTVHLTMKAAKRYLKENLHNLHAPRVYVASQYRCHEWNGLLEALKAGELQIVEPALQGE